MDMYISVRLQGFKWNTLENIVFQWKHAFEAINVDYWQKNKKRPEQTVQACDPNLYDLLGSFAVYPAYFSG